MPKTETRLALALALAVALAAGPAAAQDGDDERDLVPGDVSANLTLASDYTFRGISQTDELPALQGGIDWVHDSGLYLGFWGSNVDFDDGDQATVELDWYGGYGGTWRAVSYDVGFIYYNYPGASSDLDYDYWEAAVSLGYQPLTNAEGRIGYNYSPEYFADSGDSHYIHGSFNYLTELFLPVTFSAGAGYQFIEDNAAFGTPDYWEWRVGLAVQVERLELAVTYVDTDIARSDCAGGLDTCDARAVFSVGARF